MRELTAKEAKYGFARLIELARAEPLVVAKHGRSAEVVLLPLEKFDWLDAVEPGQSRPGPLMV